MEYLQNSEEQMELVKKMTLLQLVASSFSKYSLGTGSG